jgi:hypothetical protein
VVQVLCNWVVTVLEGVGEQWLCVLQQKMNKELGGMTWLLHVSFLREEKIILFSQVQTIKIVRNTKTGLNLKEVRMPVTVNILCLAAGFFNRGYFPSNFNFLSSSWHISF